MVKIIVDSSCDLPEELLEEFDIKVLSQRIMISGKEYLDKITINSEEVYSIMESGIIPKTSFPRPMEIYGLFKQCCMKGKDFIYIAISSGFSGCYQLAVSILKEVEEQYEGIRMAVIDSKSASTATGLIALQAAKLSRAGMDFDTIVRNIKFLADHVEHIFTVGDLSWLVKGGRISRTEGAIGGILNIKPILQVRNGAVEVAEKVRGRKKVLMTIVDIMEERIKDFPDQTIGISHAGDMGMVSELEKMIKQRIGTNKMIINKIGAVLTSHLGIGGAGVFFFNKKPEIYMK
jgi:DegV family protein with EDD domain